MSVSTGESTDQEVLDLLELAERLASLLDEVPLDGNLDVEPTASRIRVLENLLIAARGLQSVCVLIATSLNGQRKDLTESAAVMVRQIVELYGETLWMMGKNGAEADGRALRAELSNTREISKKVDKMVAGDPGFPVSDVELARKKLSELETEEASLKDAIQVYGLKPKGRPDMTSVLTKSPTPGLAFYWSYQSDVAHGGSMARNRSRVTPFEIEAGASPTRRAELLSVSITAAGHLLDLALTLVILPEGGSAELRGRLQAEVMEPYGQMLSGDATTVPEA